MFSTDHKTNVAIDIETTGFEVDGQVTVFGMLIESDEEQHAYVILNNGGCLQNTGSMSEVAKIQQTIKDVSPSEVEFATVADERILLQEIRSLLFERFDTDYDRLVAYHGETWNGGFDLPYLRSRYNALKMEWPFSGFDYLDLYPIISKRFNTALQGDGDDEVEDHNDLVHAHQILCNPKVEFDPYDDSAQAVSDYLAGNFIPLVQHNVSDIHRTADLAKIAEEYASPKQMQTDRL